MAQELTIRRRCCSRDFLVLTALNVALVAVAVTTLYFRQQLVHAKWIDVVRGAFDRYADTFTTGMLVFALTLLVLVALGSIATALRIKKLLVVHGMALTLTLIALVFLTISAFQVSHEANAWQQQPFDSSAAEISSTNSNDTMSTAKETRVATHFNALYCDAQRAYLCDRATLSDVLHFGLDALTANASRTDAALADSNNNNIISSACAQYANASREWQQVCAYCSEHKRFEDFAAIVSWSHDHCDFSASTAVWCAHSSLAAHNSPNVGARAGGEPPYSLCRASLLQATVIWSRGFGIAWSVAGVLLVLLLVSVALLLHTHPHAVALDLDDVEGNAADTVLIQT